MPYDPGANRRRAVDFYRTAFLGDPGTAVARHVGDTYIQHNPVVADGPQGFVDYFTRMAREHPDKSITFLRTVAEGDLVALHTHQVWPGDGEYVTMDFFRFDDEGKIVEHWDAIQAVPTATASGNPMF
ncbi:MAG: ester cyclase [Gammaproteobacteria bacterium]|nr:ester cyclase [Gammaproteobacteria bacterium]